MKYCRYHKKYIWKDIPFGGPHLHLQLTLNGEFKKINSMISQSYTAKQHYIGENVFCFSAKFCKIAFNKLHLLHQDQTQVSKIC